MYQQQPQLQGVADLLANQGRYGDSMLVHMNPVEVQGLASMSPTGSLTVNPQTGQPEAFLPFLAPLLGGMLGSAAVGTGGILAGTALAGKTALAGAIGSGLGTAIAEGDLKKGLISGITGFGIGSALGKIGSAAADAATDAATSTALQEGATVVKDVAGNVTDVLGQTMMPEGALVLPEAASTAGVEIIKDSAGNVIDVLGQTMMPEGALVSPNLGPSAREIFSGEGLKALATPQALIPMAIAEDTNIRMTQDEMYEKMAKDARRQKGADYEQGVARRDANVFDPNITPDPFATTPAYGSGYAQYANAGGIVSLDPNDFRRRFGELQALDRPVVGMFTGGPFSFPNYGNVGMGPNNPIPAGRQAALRDPNVISPEQLQQTYESQGLPGFGPEIMYFTPEKGFNPNPYEGWTPDPVAPPTGGGDDGTGGGENPVLNAYQRLQAGEITFEQFQEIVGQNINLGDFAGLRLGAGGQNIPDQGSGSAEGTTSTTITTDPSTAKNLTADEIADLYGKYMNYGGGFNFGMQEGGFVRESIVKYLANQRKIREKDKKRKREVDPFTFEQWKGRASGEIEDLLELIMDKEKGDKEKARRRGLPSASGMHPMQIFHSGAAEEMLRGDDFVESMQEGGETQAQTEADRLIDLAQMAVLGRLPEEEADVVIQAFIDEFGEEAFQVLRESTLEGVVPGSQKEGEIVGMGGGMDDMIPGMIGDQQPVAVSPGEYIVPADVVSGIGDGSTDSGVQQLDGMLDRVRMDRTGTTQQPAPLARGGMLPR
jgi:hypothetical protein